LVLRGVGYLPKELAVGFSQYKANFDGITVTYVPPVQVTKPAYQTPKATSFAMRDSDLHKEASRAGQLKEFDKAERLYREAIDKNINRAAATRDLAMLLDQLKRPEEAVELLEKKIG
ncbi:MAG: tetratricopeptide repeat protein, partial [Saprospiraceae bacterium]|nr:tetratricopeptide repeat protein [Saprospiraceae bacterium]